MRMRHVICLPMVIAGMFAASAFSAPNLKIGDTAAQGGTRGIEVPVSLEGVSGNAVISTDIRIMYDPQRLEFVSIAATGTLTEKWAPPVYNENSPGSILVPLFDQCVGGSSHTITTDGILFRLLFNAKPALVPITTGISVSRATMGVIPVNDLLTPSTRAGSVTIDAHTLCTDLSSVKVFPNPYKPGSHTGQDSSVLGTGIIFSQLTARATIRIFTIAGDLVRELDETDGNGWCLWDAKNRAGQPVASGVYLYSIVNPDKASDKARGKIAIMR